MVFVPKFKLDLATASVAAFQKFLEDFEAWRAGQPPRELDLTNGWKVIDQEMAEGMLLRNPLGANRRPALPTVKHYARQMVAGMWKKTGQPIIFTDKGVGIDLGHRLLACYLSGASFPTFMVADVPHEDTLFAFLDAGKNRTAADALATAGLNGQAKLLAQVVSMAMHFEQHCYTPTTKKPIQKMTPIEIIHYVQEYNNLRLGVRLMAGEYKAAATVLAYQDVASFMAFQIIELHGEPVLEGFMTELGQVAEQPDENSSIAAFQKVMEEDARSREPMKKHMVLGHAIKAFNAWVLQEPVRKLSLRVNEQFPRFVSPQPTQQAAE